MKQLRSGVYKKMLLTLCSLTLMVGCGSGGGSTGSFVSLNSGATTTETLQIDNSNLQLNGSANVSANFVDVSGHPITGLLVTFTTTLGSFNPPAGTAVTDTTGTAPIQLLAGNTSGSGIVTASATVNGVKFSKPVSFAVALPPIFISAPSVGVATPLTPGGTTGISVTLYSDAAHTIPFTAPVDVSFTSNFSLTGKASLLSPVRTDANGVANSTYTASGGVGTDIVTISVGTASVTTSVTIAGTAAGSISFVSATPRNITLKGMGGVGGSETSTVVFKVLDTNGQPKAGQTVNFSLNTTVGGLALVSPSASSASDGTVSTTVQAGIVSTPVRVTATTTIVVNKITQTISTQSDLLVVSTGIPSQSYMSLSVATLNPEAFSVDGVTDVFTARLADHFGNPVPDGTAINFTAQSGLIDPSCLTVNGACSATWRSQGDRMADGRSAILAYAIGEESFVDTTGDGVANGIGSDLATCLAAGNKQISVTCGEFTDTTQAWRDDGHVGQYVPAGTAITVFPGFPGDPFIDFNHSGTVNRDGYFNGILRDPAAVVPLNPFNTKHVFSNSVIVMSTSSAQINDLVTTISPADPAGGGFTPVSTAVAGSVQDANLNRLTPPKGFTANPMPAGTSISVGSNSTCLTTTGGGTVGNTTFGPTDYIFTVTNSCGTGKSGSITVSVTSPGGVITSRTFSLSW